MLIELTAEELQKIQDIQASYQPERDALQKQIVQASNDGNQEERKRLVIQKRALIDRMQEELHVFNENCQRERFNQIEGGAAGIIANAKEQAPEILELMHKDTERDAATYDAKTLKEAGVAIRQHGKLYLNANYAAAWLRDELKLHIEALREDKTALQELLAAIIEAVEASPYTDNTEITNEASKPLEVMRFRRSPLSDIKLYGLMNDKTNAQLLQDGDIFQREADGQLTIRWAVSQTEQVATYVALTYEGMEGKVTKKLTAFDSAVYNALATRFYYWQQANQQKPLYITPQEIWRTMNGKRSGDGKAKPSKAQVQRICDSVDKMRFTRFYMDISEEIKAFNLTIEDERIVGGFVDGYLLSSSKVEFTTDKGNTVVGYRIAEEPLLYTYNAAKNHILYVPYTMLDTSTNTSDSENVTEFRNYLLQQIQLMKNAAEEKKGKYFKRNNIILLSTIYRDTGIQPPEERIAGKEYQNDTIRQREVRRFRQADRQKIEGILDAWKTKGWIKGYTVINSKNQPVKERQQAKGYSISI